MSGVDANKTALTRKVTAAASLWLSERGFRPIESEVYCADRWTADIAGFCSPTRTEAQKLKLIAKRPQWKNRDDHHVFEAWSKTFEALPFPVTGLVEVKTSLNDFRRDRKFERPPAAHLQWLAIPAGLLDPADTDERWGLLIYHEKAGVVKCVRPAPMKPLPPRDVLRVVINIALRRDAHTRYERLREFDRQAREDNNERTNRMRIQSAIGLVRDIQSGKRSIEYALRYHFITREKMPQWLLDDLQTLVPAVPAETPRL